MLLQAFPFIAMAFGATPPGAAADTAEPVGHVTARLICATTALVPGTTNELGIHLTIEPGWHVYWDGTNDSGFPLSAAWTLPEGWQAGAIRWPAPTRHVLPGNILDHVYLDSVTLFVPVEVPGAGAGATVTISADLNWLECGTVCVPGRQVVTLTLPVAEKGQMPGPSKEAKELEKARGRLPRALPKDKSTVALAWSDGRVEISVPGARELFFYPGNQCTRLSDPVRDGEAKGSRMNLELGKVEGAVKARLQGVLEVRGRGSPWEAIYYEVDSRPEP